ncbi:P-loop containing nucleoside triphosphate hydrolase protein [Mucor lusitanicus]
MCFAQFIAGCSVAFSKGWRLSIVMIAVTPAIACTGGVMGILVTKYTVETQDAYADAGSISEQVFAGIRTVYSFSLQNRFAKRYEEKLDKAMRAGIKRGIILGTGLGIFMFCLFAMYGLSFWYGSRLVHDHIMDGSTVLVVFLSMMMGEFSLLQLPTNLAAVSSASAAAYKIFETIKRVPDIDTSSPDGVIPSQVLGELEFKHVKFRYPTRPDTIILKDLSLKIKPGMTVAFVGPSGSGKSTSVQLLQRFYDPMSGSVSLDGKNLKELNVKWLRQQIGVVSQEPVLFNTSIRQNLMMGSENRNISMEEITAACKKANCHSFIKQLPKGYSTLVGEHGGMLSGGQKQRIAIARAILKNPAILLLDEATSALDTQSERLVQKALDEAAANRTTIVVAHRLSTVRNADLIVVMQHGDLIEQGTHDDLIAKGGVYSELVKKQQIQTSSNNTHNRKTKQEEEQEDEILLRNEAMEVNRKSCIELNRASNNASIISVPAARKSRFSVLDGFEEKLRREKKLKKSTQKMKAPVWKVFMQMRPQWGWCVLGSIGACIAGTVFPLYALFFAKVITMLNENDDKDYGPMEGPNMYSFLFVILGMFAFLGFALQTVSFEIAGAKYTKTLRSMLFVSFMKQEIGYFDRDENNVGSLTSKLAVDAKNVNEMITRAWPDVVQIAFTSAIGMTIAFMHSWKLTLIIMCMTPLIVGAAGWNSKVQEGFEGSTKEANEQSAEVASEAIKEIRTVTALNKQSYFEERYYNATERPHRLAQRKAYTSSIGFALLQGTSLYTNAVAFYAGSKLITQGNLDLSDMVITMMSIMIMADGVGRSSIFVSTFAKAKIAAITTFEVLNRQPAIDSELEGIEPEGEDIDGDIDFSSIAFRYPARPDIPIFDGEFNLKGKQGQTIALVGPSGSGKSTTIGMLQRWYDPLSGTVRVDNHNVKSYTLGNLRSHMALVSQEPTLFDMTIGENIRFGVDDSKEVTQEEVEAVCKSANIHNFIVSLPKGYDQRVGDKGSQLSGGQKQRIAIARALIRKPKILLLDEATSALDSESEKLVQKALDNIIQEGGRTTITIAHRLSTITNADLICVIKDGKVIEQGNHWQLLKLDGVYKSLVQQQSLSSSSG